MNNIDYDILYGFKHVQNNLLMCQSARKSIDVHQLYRCGSGDAMVQSVSNQVYNIYIIIVFVKRLILQCKLFKYYNVKRVLYFVMQTYPEK